MNTGKSERYIGPHEKKLIFAHHDQKNINVCQYTYFFIIIDKQTERETDKNT